MTNPQDRDPREGVSTGAMGLWTGVGIALGAGLGTAFDNTGIGVAIGMALGVAVGQMMASRKSR